MPQLEELKLSVEVAEAVIEKGIEYGAYSDEMPDTKKEKLAAADEIVTFSIDAYINDGITSDDEDPAVAESGAQIEEILEIAGVEIEDGEAVFNDPPDVNGGSKKSDKGGDDEAPFDPDDYIEGYSELSVVTKLKKVKELDIESDDDAAVLEAIYDWENEQEKPSSRVLNYIDEVMPAEDAPADETADEAGDEPEAEAEGDDGEPWEGYDKASAVQIKKVLQDALEDEDAPLTKEQVEYVLEYEESREKPPPRKRVIDFCTALIEQFDNGDDEPAEEPEKPKRGRGRAAAKKEEAASNGVVTLTRDDILTALADGEVVIEL